MLTDFQRGALALLREHNCHWLAKSAEEAWNEGRRTYIDDRVRCPRWLRRMFNKANDEAEKEAKP